MSTHSVESAETRVRVGIDVGGTFTHAVAIDAATHALRGKAKVPTTHRAAEGVARGVVESLLKLLAECRLSPQQVVVIAHSTTQATNALLEGDVAPVGILAVADSGSAWLARRQTNIRPIPLAPGRRLRTIHRFLRGSAATDAAIERMLCELKEAGAAVIVAAEAFSVDDPTREQRICEVAARVGLPATATHHVSRLHGLGIRTRTAVINASMLPRMLQTADMTEMAVRQAGISAPIMIMRSDGGVMDLREMRRRPILTMLSGPAAGVAAALLYAGVSDGIFLEVGGTSTDISAIKNARCQVRSAAVGGQKLHVRTLDVRTIGVAGGSLAVLRGGTIAAVGPRSAHIAGLRYLSFEHQPPAGTTAGTVEVEGDAILAAQAADAPVAITPTCAANLLGLVPDGDPARGRPEAIVAGFRAAQTRVPHCAAPEDVARQLLERASEPVLRLIDGLVRDYKLDRSLLRLIGGGGGAAAIVPYVAQRMKLPFELAENADVISAIGVALALLRDSVERTVVSPTPEDIRAIREEVYARVLQMGAVPETIEVFVEVDALQNRLCATAEGATDTRRAAGGARSHAAEAAEVVRESIAALAAAVVAPPRVVAETPGLAVWLAEHRVRRLAGLIRERRAAIRVLDRRSAIRWACNHADVRSTQVAAADRELESLALSHARYSDAGARIPRCVALVESRIIDLSGLIELRQAQDVLRTELKHRPPQQPCVLLAALGED